MLSEGPRRRGGLKPLFDLLALLAGEFARVLIARVPRKNAGHSALIPFFNPSGDRVCIAGDDVSNVFQLQAFLPHQQSVASGANGN